MLCLSSTHPIVCTMYMYINLSMRECPLEFSRSCTHTNECLRIYSARPHSLCIWIWKPSVLLKIVLTQTCKAGLFFAWSTCTFFWLVIFLRVLYLLLTFKKVWICRCAVLWCFQSIYFQILMIFFYEKWLLYIHYIILVGELKFFAGEWYRRGIRLYCLMQYILTKNNHI